MTKEQFYEKYCKLAKSIGEEVTKSSVTAGQLKAFEKKYSEKYDIKMPQEYLNFISAAAHNIETYNGMIDDIFAEDDVEIELVMMAQPAGDELSYIEELLDNPSCGPYMKAGYIPLGFFDEEAYLLCIDTRMDGIVMKYFDYEGALECETREDFEEHDLALFDCFEDFILCFFEGRKYDAGKCGHYND